jgi:pyruvate dehydrogenase E1 component alpha subunit
MTKEEIIKFEEEIADLYKQGKIRAPIHLGGGNEGQLIEIFKNVKPSDWIFSTWRSHYHWLLSGRDPGDLREQILTGHSMHVFGERFFTSAIVAGIAPVAVGVAWSIKQANDTSRVWCFLGDMAASVGIAMESIRYACGHDLPINFIIEDNNLSVRTDTKLSWGCKVCHKNNHSEGLFVCNPYKTKNVTYYEYNRNWPHAGCGVFVLF